MSNDRAGTFSPLDLPAFTDTGLGRITNAIKADTAELLEAFRSFKGAMKVLEWIGKAAKPLGYVAGFCASMYAFWTAVKSGVTPK